jgi:DNA polymerase III delta prime subunit
VKKSPGLVDLEAKQEKAQELREQQLSQKIKKSAEKKETIAQRLMKIEEERKLKKELLNEKMQKAEQNRAQHIRSIQQKAKSDLEKLDEVHHNSINRFDYLRQPK